MRVARTEDLTSKELDGVRRMAAEAFGAHWSDHDWEHALGGVHFFVEERGKPVSHAVVVERALEAGGYGVRGGYVEAVATRPDREHRGLATEVMRAAGDHIREVYELGALSTRENAFYARLGWETWRGQTFVRTAHVFERTPREDGLIMILRTPRTPPELDLDGRIVCEWRAGDVW